MNHLISRLPRREQQIARLLGAHGELTASEVCRHLEGDVSNGAVRTMLQRLIAKGVVSRRRLGHKFVYRPASPDPSARRAALMRVAEDYFGGCLSDMAGDICDLISSDVRL